MNCDKVSRIVNFNSIFLNKRVFVKKFLYFKKKIKFNLFKKHDFCKTTAV